jgi:hypothetical protein
MSKMLYIPLNSLTMRFMLMTFLKQTIQYETQHNIHPTSIHAIYTS